MARSNYLFRLLDALPDEFTNDDFKKLLKEKEMSLGAWGTYLKRMEQRELIMRKGTGWKKIFNS